MLTNLQAAIICTHGAKRISVSPFTAGATVTNSIFESDKLIEDGY